jgi:hypothetical protein
MAPVDFEGNWSDESVYDDEVMETQLSLGRIVTEAEDFEGQ